MHYSKILKVASLLALSLLASCGKDRPTLSVLPDSQTFNQNKSTLNNRLDILWVVDNSGSMSSIQQTLTNAFQSFIAGFQTKNYDFHMAVTTTEAYLAGPAFRNQPALARFKDGLNSHTGVFVMTPNTPNLTSVFVTDATTGSGGSGDERAFQSFRETLNSPLNTGFRRPDAYMAVIIISDEDDFSSPTRAEYGGTDHNYSDPGLETVDTYVHYLDTLTGSSGEGRRYNVSTINVLDANCKPNAGSIVGVRYKDIVQKTGGLQGNVCDSTYDTVLANLQQHIAELSTQFFLDRTPDPSSIVVVVDGKTVANDGSNGWTYQSSSNSVVFHGSGVPPQNAVIQINFQPLTAK